METRIYHGTITPDDFAQALVADFSQGNLQAQVLGDPDHLAVQIATRPHRESGGQTAISVTLQKVEDGVLVSLGDQQWLGVAASLGSTALAGLRNPLFLLGRLDDLAQDITSLQLPQAVWQTLTRVAEAAGATHEISDRLRRLECAYCGVAAPVGEPTCPACGAPLGEVQPTACPRCGYVVSVGRTQCPNCGTTLRT